MTTLGLYSVDNEQFAVQTEVSIIKGLKSHSRETTKKDIKIEDFVKFVSNGI